MDRSHTTPSLGRRIAKAKKGYPDNTVLIVNCNADGMILDDEWSDTVERVKSTDLHKTFLEVILIEAVGHHFTALWGWRRSKQPINSLLL